MLCLIDVYTVEAKILAPLWNKPKLLISPWKWPLTTSFCSIFVSKITKTKCPLSLIRIFIDTLNWNEKGQKWDVQNYYIILYSRSETIILADVRSFLLTSLTIFLSRVLEILRLWPRLGLFLTEFVSLYLAMMQSTAVPDTVKCLEMAV